MHFLNNLNLLSPQLEKLATVSGPIILFCGVSVFGQTIIAGAIGITKGTMIGLLMPSSPSTNENSSEMIDVCFNSLELAGIFLWRKSITLLREGIKGGLSGIIQERTSGLLPWCGFYKPTSLIKIEKNDNIPPNNNKFGDNNNIYGTGNTVYGKNNTIYGNGNTVYGDNNHINGNHLALI